MIKGVSHIGIAVGDLEKARELYQKIFGKESSDPEWFGEIHFSFIPFGNTQIELLESTTPEGVMRKFIEKKGEGVHHISFEVDDIEAELAALKVRGVQLINEKPYLNAHKDLVAFINPKSTRGVLVELIQYMDKKKE
ncbi:MAG: methylmalonyl-CoA epimerase [Thermodesulfobacteriota bacterium]